MTEDNVILFFAFMICWLTIVGLTISNKHKKQTLVISLAIQIPYTIFFFMDWLLNLNMAVDLFGGFSF